MARSTPWGPAQEIVSLLTGFSTVSTAGHGGMMISEGAANRCLSKAARKRALMHNTYFCYEEDCDFLIPLFDAKALRTQLMAGVSFWEDKTAEEIEEYLIKQLSNYHGDYLIEIGVEPDQEIFEKAKLREEYYQACGDRSPLVATSCSGDWSTLIPGIFKIFSADNKIHYITEDSYKRMNSDPILAITRPMSALQEVDLLSFPPMEDRLIEYVTSMQVCYAAQIDEGREEARLEAIGKYYGPRSRFNGSMETVRRTFVAEITDRLNIDSVAATELFKNKLQKIRTIVHPELRNTNIFKHLLDDPIKTFVA